MVINLNTKVRKIAFSGAIAALYIAITLAIMPLSFGPVQIRFSEVLTILPFFFPASIWGIFIGCIIANLFSPYGLIDIVVGPTASLIAAICTCYLGMSRGRDSVFIKALACFPPVIFNAIFIGAMIAYFIVGDLSSNLFINTFIIYGLWVGLGQLIVLYLIGFPLMIYLPTTRAMDRLYYLYSGGDTK